MVLSRKRLEKPAPLRRIKIKILYPGRQIGKKRIVCRNSGRTRQCKTFHVLVAVRMFFELRSLFFFVLKISKFEPFLAIWKISVRCYCYTLEVESPYIFCSSLADHGTPGLYNLNFGWLTSGSFLIYFSEFRKLSNLNVFCLFSKFYSRREIETWPIFCRGITNRLQFNIRCFGAVPKHFHRSFTVKVLNIQLR